MKEHNSQLNNILNNEASDKAIHSFFSSLQNNPEESSFSETFDKDVDLLLTGDAESEWETPVIPSERMKKRFINSIRPTINRYHRLQVAAILIPFFILSGLLGFLSDRTGIFTPVEYSSLEVPLGKQMQVVLPDGSQVFLNSGSHLKYPNRFSLFNREVEFEGEGYFIIAKNKNKPFRVNLKELGIEVTGTRFNVKAYPDDAYTSVYLVEGGVSLSLPFDQNCKLYPNQQLVYDKSKKKWEITATAETENITGWKSGKLHFSQTPLSEILKTLKRQHGIKFEVTDSSLLNTSFTFEDSSQDVKSIFKELEKVSDIRFTKVKDQSYKISIDMERDE